MNSPTAIPQIEPLVWTAGETVQWTRNLATDFPATTWTLNYYLRGPAEETITATASGSAFAITVAASRTANFAAGDYRLLGRVSKDGAVYTVYDQHLLILADPATQHIDDNVKSYWRDVRDKLRDAIKALVQKPERSVSLLGRSYTFASLNELRDFLAFAESKVQSEEQQAAIDRGEPLKKNILIRFNTPT